MVTYGIDISDYQKGLNLAEVKAQGYDFVFAQTSYGTNKTETFSTFKTEAEAAKLLFAAYHFLEATVSVAEQVKVCKSVAGSLPVFLDVERGNWTTVEEFYAQAKEQELNLKGLYTYPGYWVEYLHRASFVDHGALWAADYGSNGKGFGSVVYSNVQSYQWNDLGGIAPTILQFGSQVVLSDWNGLVDGNAFHGTKDQLIATNLFHNWGATPPPPVDHDRTYRVQPGDTMTSIAAKFGVSLSALEKENPQIPNPNRIYPNEVVTIP